MPKPGFFKVVRAGLEFLRLARIQFTPVCPNPACPLKLNKSEGEVIVTITKKSVDEQVRRQKVLHKRNHPNG